tara:strand:+ start:10831 stop:11427 length:597 start_codon:yes stop_codon:yes gene_type:complete
MNSKTIGSLLIAGTILTMGVWMFFGLSTDNMSPADRLAVFIENKTQVQIVTLVTSLGFMCLVLGLYYSTRNLLESIFSEIGGLLLIASLPFMVALNMSDIVALEMEKQFSNGADILTAASAFEYLFLTFMGGVFLIGIGLTIERKFRGIIGALLAITSGIALLSSFGLDLSVLDFVGWLGTWALMLVMGVLFFLQKEK